MMKTDNLHFFLEKIKPTSKAQPNLLIMDKIKKYQLIISSRYDANRKETC